MAAIDPASLDIPECFSTERLDVRAPHPDHAREMRDAIAETIAELRCWLPWAQEVPTLTEAEESLRESRRKYRAREDFRLNLFLKGTDTFVGGSGLHRFDWRIPRFEIGYWIRNRFVGQGYATEAVQGIAAFALDQLGAKRVEIQTGTRNKLSVW